MASSLAHNNAPGRVIAVVIVAVVVLAVLRFAIARRQGYTVGTVHRIVRCSKGHVFTTLWVPGGSLKAIRFGWTRFQRCPVGKHWSFVRPVRDDELTDEERRSAEEYRSRIP